MKVLADNYNIDIKKWSAENFCIHCRSELSINAHDVKYLNERWEKCCPLCKKFSEIHGEIPQLIKDKIMSEGVYEKEV